MNNINEYSSFIWVFDMIKAHLLAAPKVSDNFESLFQSEYCGEYCQQYSLQYSVSVVVVAVLAI